MNKKNTIIFSVILTVIASILCFYFTGCLSTGIFNKGQGLVRMLVMLTPGLAGLLMPVELIVAVFFIMRLYRRPNAIKRFLKTYSITLIVLSAVGLISAILAGILLYKSFIEPSPFPGFLIIITIWHVFIITLGILVLAVYRKRIHVAMEDNRHRGGLHNLWTVILAINVFYAFNRFGAFLISPFYIQWRTLDLTWPFYITLLSLIVLVIQGLLYYFDVYNSPKKKSVGIIISSSLILIFVGSFITTGIIGYNSPLFLSAVSPAVPFERMLTKPVEFVLHSLAFIVTSGFVLFISIKEKVKDSKYNTEMAKIKERNLEGTPISTDDIKEEKKEEVTPVIEIKEKVEIKEEPKKEEPVVVKEVSKEEPKKIIIATKVISKKSISTKQGETKKPSVSKATDKKPETKKPTVKKESKTISKKPATKKVATKSKK